MIDILIVIVVAAVLTGLFRPSRLRRLAQWRVAAGVAPIGLFVAAAFVALRGGWIVALSLAVAGCGLAALARWPRVQSAAAPSGELMSLEDARAMLGVEPGAGEAEIQAAYLRLMRRVHPDHGGASGLATQLNIARDRLLGR